MKIDAPIAVPAQRAAIELTETQDSADFCLQAKRTFPRSTSPGQMMSFANQVANRYGVEAGQFRFENGPGDARTGVVTFCGQGRKVQEAVRAF